MNISGVIYESLVDGIGVRTVIFISGCSHYCKKCQNTEAQSFTNGREFTLDLQKSIIKRIKNNPLIEGVTLSGGDPFCSAKDVTGFVKLLKEHIPKINIWAYTGFTFEEILNSNDQGMIKLLKLCDVLIDGRFIEEQKDLTLRFRGSKNQRIILVQESLQSNKIITLE